MELPTDITFYVKNVETLGNLDIPLRNEEEVSINLIDDLPEDANELIGFLETEQCPGKYWISISIAYANVGKLKDAEYIIEKAMKQQKITNEEIGQFERYLQWINLKYCELGINKFEKLNQIGDYIDSRNDIEQNDQDVQFLSLKAVYNLAVNNEEESLKDFEKILKVNETNCFAMLGKAQILLKYKKNYRQILKLYQQVLLLNPIIKPDPRIGIGLCFWYLKDYKMAITSWERSLELDNTNLKAKILLNLSKFNETFNYSLSDEEFKNNYKKCLIELKHNYDKAPNDPVILLSFVSYYFTKGNHPLVEKICNEIITKIMSESQQSNNTSLNQYSKNLLSQCSFWLGRIYFLKEDFSQSQRYFLESSRFNEHNLLAKIGLGQSQISRGSTQEAILTFENLIKISPKNLEINYCLGLLYSRSKSKKRLEMAIHVLEKYINLCNNRGVGATNLDGDDELMSLNKEPVILNAYLILSKLYEAKDINQSLNYLNKAVESRNLIGKPVPLEIYNNIGVFNFNKSNFDVATKSFEKARENWNNVEIKRSDKSDAEKSQLVDDLKITLDYNFARSLETSDEAKSIEIYNDLFKVAPNYFSSKLRLLFLNLVSTNETTKEEIKNDIEQMLETSPSNLEIRSFYSWFIKTFGKKIGLKPDADTEHQKETLVSYNSHDCYALISLANIYCIMARDLKPSSGGNNGNATADKRKKYYIRAIELFSKVLSIDAKNVYAAQGLAVVYIENQELNKGLDILRKIRDSLNDISIYLNLGHVLLELKQFTKSIENYEIALNKFSNGNDSNILTFLSKAWLLRGNSEKNLNFLNKSLDYSKKSLENSLKKNSNALKFNISFIEFQIADYLIKLPVQDRKIEDLDLAINNLNEGIKILNELSSDDEKNPPYSKTDLKARANLGVNTLLNRLIQSLQETKEYHEEIDNKLQQAKKVRDEEIAKQKELEELEHLKKLELEEQRAKERLELQEQAQQWVEEKMLIDEDNDDKLFDEESKKENEEGKEKEKGKKKKGKKSRKKKDIIEDSEEEDLEPEIPDPEPSDSEQVDESTDNKKRKADDVNNQSKKFKSDEFIQDSDDGLDDDLFNDNDPEPSHEPINEPENEPSNENGN